jgi:hypothetical protein
MAFAYFTRVLLTLAAILPASAAFSQPIVVGLVPAGAAPTGIGDAIPRYADQESVTVR